MNGLLPRLGLRLPRRDEPAAIVAKVAHDLLGAGSVDIIFLEEAQRLRALLPSVEARVLGRGRTADQLEAARQAKAVPLIPGGDGLALLEERLLDGLLLTSPPSPTPARLRLREGVCVVEPFPLGGEATAARLAERLPGLSDALARLCPSSPQPVLLEHRGARDLATLAEEARRSGLSFSGPLTARAATAQGPEAWIVLDPDQADLLLALRGSGPEVVLDLSLPRAWPATSWEPLRPPPTGQGVRLAATRLLRILPLGGRRLAAAEEVARQPTVSIASRPPDTSKGSQERGRCPFCRRQLGESPDGGAGSPGPAVACAECGTEHHRDCIVEHGRCTILGCEGSRVLRLGVTIPIARLGSASPAHSDFETIAGDSSLAPGSLRLEAPIDDPDARPTRRRLAIELPTGSAKRGEVLHGYVVVWAPRPFRVRGGALSLQASLTKRDRSSGRTSERTQPILHRRASFVGDAPAGALGRLQDEVVGLFVKGKGVAIPVGVRRYPFSLRLDPGHPVTVTNRHGKVEEAVTTVLSASLDTETVELVLEVR